MKHIKLFEELEFTNKGYTFDPKNVRPLNKEFDIFGYVHDFWNVDPEYLKEIINYELEENSLKRIEFIFEREDDKRNFPFFKMTTKLEPISTTSREHNPILLTVLDDFFTNLEKIEKNKPYKDFIRMDKGKIADSEYYATSVYYKYLSQDNTSQMGQKVQIFLPEIILHFDKDTILDDGNIGEWEDSFNSLFKKVGIPYKFDGDNSWNNNGQVCYVLYHT